MVLLYPTIHELVGLQTHESVGLQTVVFALLVLLVMKSIDEWGCLPSSEPTTQGALSGMRDYYKKVQRSGNASFKVQMNCKTSMDKNKSLQVDKLLNIQRAEASWPTFV
jgi:hypothetical protein